MKQKHDDSEEVVTKGFFRSELEKELEKVRTEAKNYHDEVLNGLDGVVKELENMREDNTIGTYQIREVREQSEDHEKRITKLERVQKPA